MPRIIKVWVVRESGGHDDAPIAYFILLSDASTFASEHGFSLQLDPIEIIIEADKL